MYDRIWHEEEVRRHSRLTSQILHNLTPAFALGVIEHMFDPQSLELRSSLP